VTQRSFPEALQLTQLTLAHGTLRKVQPAKTTLFAGGNEADVRKAAGAPSSQASFSS
jgi:hypothetical protein